MKKIFLWVMLVIASMGMIAACFLSAYYLVSWQFLSSAFWLFPGVLSYLALKNTIEELEAI